MSFVLDASVTVEWFVVGDHADAASKVAIHARDVAVVVPQLWPLEVANVLTLAARRGKLERDQRDSALQTLASMTIEVENETAVRAWSTTVALADKHQLTIYDATYLELAVRRRLPLATFDGQLIRAARAEGVAVLP